MTMYLVEAEHARIEFYSVEADSADEARTEAQKSFTEYDQFPVVDETVYPRTILSVVEDTDA